MTNAQMINKMGREAALKVRLLKSLVRQNLKELKRIIVIQFNEYDENEALKAATRVEVDNYDDFLKILDAMDVYSKKDFNVVPDYSELNAKFDVFM